MKVKEIYVEIKKSVNYQTYTYGELVEVEGGMDVVSTRKVVQEDCRKEVLKMIEADNQETIESLPPLAEAMQPVEPEEEEEKKPIKMQM